MFVIEYGPGEKRIVMPGVKVMQVVAKAEALVAGGATDLRIHCPDGTVMDLPQFKADLARMIIS